MRLNQSCKLCCPEFHQPQFLLLPHKLIHLCFANKMVINIMTMSLRNYKDMSLE